MAGLALGGHGNNKSRLVEEGSYRPLIDLIKFPDRDVQLSAVLAVASIVLGDELETKSAFMTEEGLVPLIELVSHRDDEVSGTAVYALVYHPHLLLGSHPQTPRLPLLNPHLLTLSEPLPSSQLYYLSRAVYLNTRTSRVVSSTSTASLLLSNRCNALLVVKLLWLCPIEISTIFPPVVPSHRFLTMYVHSFITIVKQLNVGNVEVKRAAGYFLATICEEVEFHGDLYKEGAFQAIVALVRHSTVP